MAGGFDLNSLQQVFGAIQGNAQVVGNQVVNYGGYGSPDDEYTRIADFTDGVLKSCCPHGYVETDALNESQKALDSNGICIIVGWPGTGKTALGQELLKRNSQKLQPLQLRGPHDWDTIFHKDRTRNPDDKVLLIFVDNVFYEEVTAFGGCFRLWQKLFHDMEPEIRNGRAKVILAFRKQGFSSVTQNPRSPEILKRAYIVNLDALVPSDKEKVSIFRNMVAYSNFYSDLSPEEIKLLASQPNAMGFPECCSIYCKTSSAIPKKHFLYSTRQQEEETGTEIQLPEIFAALLRDGYNYFCNAATDLYRQMLEEFRKPNVDASVREWDYRLDVNDNTILHFIAQRKDKDAMKRALSEISDVDSFINDRNKKGETALHIAVRNGMAESVRLLLKKRADPALTDIEGNTVTHLAVAEEEGLIIHILANWRRALKPKVKNNAGMTPLHVAAVLGKAEAARQLMEEGADVAARDKEGCTCLHHVARQGKAEVLEALGSLSPDVLNIQNDQGRTALADSTTLPSQVTEMLLQMGADFTIEDKDGNIPIMTAIQAGNEEVAVMLLNHNPVFVILTNKVGDFPLHLALKARMAKLAKAMMRNGTDVACRGSRGQTPLMLASASGDLQLVTWMLEKTDSVLTIADKDEDGQTAADIAARLQLHEIQKLLMEKGADLAGTAATDAEDSKASPLAFTRKDDDSNQVLRDSEEASKPEPEDTDAMTPLHMAAAHGKAEGARQLVEAGADVAARDKEGCTCLHHVARHGKAEVLEALGPLSPDVLNIQNNQGRTALADSTTLPSQVTEKLLQLGADDTMEDAEGNVPIMTAIQAGNEEAALLLLKHSPTIVTVRNKAGDFPLHLALKARMVKLAKAMMRNGTDVACRGSRGQTPLMLASASGDLQLVTWMLEKTDSVLTIADKDEDGETAADIAGRVRHTDIHKLLMEKGTELGLL